MLDDAEMAVGPAGWRTYADPWPHWTDVPSELRTPKAS
jgi:hypothetical protein